MYDFFVDYIILSIFFLRFVGVCAWTEFINLNKIS